MVFFLVCCLCMMPIPLAFVRFRKKTVTTGKLALITALNLFAGYVAAIGIMGLLFVALGEGILEGGTYAPGTLLSLFVVYYGMKRSFKDRGMLEGYRPTGQAGHVAPQDIPQKPSAGKGEPAVQEAAAPGREDKQAGEAESSVELLSRIQDEAEAERREREEAAAAERRGYGPLDPQERRGRGAPVWLAAVLGGLCVVLAVAAGMLGWQNIQLQRDYTDELQKCGELEERVSRMEEAVSIAQAKAEEERLARTKILDNALIEAANRYIEMLRENSVPADGIDWELAGAAAKYMDAQKSGGAILALQVDAYIEQLKGKQDKVNDFVFELELAWASRAYEAAKANILKGG